MAASLGLFSLLSGAIPALAIDLYVSPTGDDTGNDCSIAATPCATIGSAIAQATSGDVIKLSGGTWNEPVLVDWPTVLAIEGGYSADFTSRDLSEYPSVIDETGRDNTVGISIFAPTGGTIEMVLDGLVFTNCSRGGIDAANFDGGGNVVVTVSHVRVDHSGWGLRLWSQDSTTSSLTVRDSVFRSNGSAIALRDSGGHANVLIERVEVSRNRHSAVDGTLNGSVEIRDSLIYANRTTYGGGALQLSGTLDVSIQNTTVAKTKPRNLYPAGGGVGIRLDGCDTVADIRNTIVWEPRSGDAPSVYATCPGMVGTATYNSFSSEPYLAGFSASNNLIGKPGLIKGGHLRRDSPLVDAGTCAGASVTDFEGDPRPSGAGCDIGADETVPVP